MVKMFGFLKKKVKEVVKRVSKKVEGVSTKISKGVFTKPVSKKEFEGIFKGIEIMLLENNVAFEVIDKIKKSMEKEIVGKEIKKPKQKIISSLKKSFEEVLLEGEMKSKEKPTIMMFVGVNGVGKTTCLAKFAYMCLKKKKKVVLAASDTFRAASIEQLKVHADKLGVKMIKHDYGADAAAVAFDAIAHAKKHKIDYVLIDTAGRMQSNKNLMDELKKIKRIAKPHFTVFVADSLTGNDAIEQAKTFNKEIGIDFSIVSKADVDQKGGAILSVGYVTKKPILYLGTGQKYKDLKKFKKREILDKIFA